MDVKETRKINLIRLIERTHGTRRGAQREFAEAAGLAPSHVSQMVNGTRNIGDSVARRVEKAFDLEHGYMDHTHPAPSAVVGDSAAPKDGPRYSRPDIAPIAAEDSSATLIEQIFEAVKGVPAHVREEMLATVVQIAERHHAAFLERLRAVRKGRPRRDDDQD